MKPLAVVKTEASVSHDCDELLEPTLNSCETTPATSLRWPQSATLIFRPTTMDDEFALAYGGLKSRFALGFVPPAFRQMCQC